EENEELKKRLDSGIDDRTARLKIERLTLEHDVLVRTTAFEHRRLEREAARSVKCAAELRSRLTAVEFEANARVARLEEQLATCQNALDEQLRLADAASEQLSALRKHEA